MRSLIDFFWEVGEVELLSSDPLVQLEDVLGLVLEVAGGVE